MVERRGPQASAAVERAIVVLTELTAAGTVIGASEQTLMPSDADAPASARKGEAMTSSVDEALDGLDGDLRDELEVLAAAPAAS